MTAWVLTWEEIGNWFCYFHSLSFDQASAAAYFSRRHRKALIITLQAGVSRGYLLLMPFKHLHTANRGHPQPRIDERKQGNECPESKAPFGPAVFHQGFDAYPGNTKTTTIHQRPTELLSRQTDAPKIPASIINWLKRKKKEITRRN